MPPPTAIASEQIAASQTWIREFFKLFNAFEHDTWLTKYDKVLNLGNRT